MLAKAMSLFLLALKILASLFLLTGFAATAILAVLCVDDRRHAGLVHGRHARLGELADQPVELLGAAMRGAPQEPPA